MGPQDLATRAGVSQVTVHRLEARNDPGAASPLLDVIRRAFESAGVDFIEENGGGPGVSAVSKCGQDGKAGRK